MTKQEIQKIIKNITNLWIEKYSHTFFDIERYDEIYAMAKDINNIKGVTDVILGDREIVKYTDFDKDVDYMFIHNIIIKVNNIKIIGQINLINKNGGDYNIVLCLNKTSIVNESYNHLNEKLNFGDFLGELTLCQNFNDIKKTVKKFYREGIIIGSLITGVLWNFSLSDQEIRQLGYIDTNNIEYAQPYYYIEDEDEYVEDNNEKDEPEWELLCADAEITVYHAKESQCNADVQHTASMFKLDLTDPESHKIVAMERTMMKQYGLHYGDLIKIEGTDSRDGVYQIQDTMNKRFKGKHKIDILINNDSKLGIWNNIKIYKLSNPESCYDNFKENMADALNQSSIDKRQRDSN